MTRPAALGAPEGLPLRCDQKRDLPTPLPVFSLDPEAGLGPERQLVCAACGQPITTSEARISVGGSHEHTRINPHGYEYRFGCFARAPGCASRGVPSRQSTWFTGYWWHVQECGRCGEHLGWLFFQTDSSFYGLILDRLTEITDPASGTAPS
ncbi:MAG TPA: cereblon family protein [Polyangia bacterium]|nr:cereblon family protein [Polyangia bacterium]